MNTTRRGFIKTLSASAAVAGAAGVSKMGYAANADITEKVIAIVNSAFPEVANAPEVVRAFALALQKPETPRLESLSFVTREGAKGSEAFERYVTVEFCVATNIVDLGVGQKLQLNWK